MTFKESENLIADVIREIPIIQDLNVGVFVEDSHGIDDDINRSLSELGLTIVVVTSGFDRMSNSGESLTGEIHYTIYILENIELNRLGEFEATSQSIAEDLMKELHWKKIDGFISPIKIKSLTRDVMDQKVSRATLTINSIATIE